MVIIVLSISFIYILKFRIKQKYQYLSKKCKSIGLKVLNNPKAFIESSNNIQNVYKYIEK